jgi:hypothetical protein
VDVADERTVDLQHVDGHVLQAGERRIAGPEVVEREREAPRMQLRQDLLGPVGVRHGRGLGDLDHHVVRVDGAGAKLRDQLLGEPRGPELARREVEPDAEVEPIGGPGRTLTRELGDHPVADRFDQPELLGERDELPRREQAAAGVTPSNEGLERLDHPRLDVDDGLPVEHPAIVLHGFAQPGGERQLVHRVVPASGEHDVAAGLLLLGLVHR